MEIQRRSCGQASTCVTMRYSTESSSQAPEPSDGNPEEILWTGFNLYDIQRRSCGQASTCVTMHYTDVTPESSSQASEPPTTSYSFRCTILFPLSRLVPPP
eukprot:3538297-Pyramimonas_sp.AAC.1